MTKELQDRYIAAKLAYDAHHYELEQLNTAGVAIEKEFADIKSLLVKTLPNGVYLLPNGDALVRLAVSQLIYAPVVVSK